jgi:hypothetical protein
LKSVLSEKQRRLFASFNIHFHQLVGPRICQQQPFSIRRPCQVLRSHVFIGCLPDSGAVGPRHKNREKVIVFAQER